MNKTHLFYPIVISLLMFGGITTALAVPVTVVWDSVTTNDDGSPMTDLAGYRLFYSETSFQRGGGYMSVHEAMADSSITKVYISPNNTQHTLDLPGGRTYYFRLAAYDYSYNHSGLNVDGGGGDVEVVWVAPYDGIGGQAGSGRSNVFYPLRGQSANIRYDLVQDGPVEIRMYNHRGGEIALIENTSRPAGRNISYWNGRNSSGQLSASGVYVAVIRTSGGTDRKKVVLIK